MKKAVKYVLLMGLFLQGSLNLTAQEESKTDEILEKFSLTPQIGLLHSWSDFKEDGIGGLTENNELGLNLLLNYKFNKFINISAGGMYGKVSGGSDRVNTAGSTTILSRDLGFGILYNTNIFELTLPRIDVNLTRLIFKDQSKFFNKFSVGLIGSHGLVFSDSEIYAKEDESVNLIYINETSPSDKRGSSGSMKEAVTSYGLGLSYIINDRFDIGVETTVRNVWNDRFDAWESNGSSNDKYSFTAIGVTYHLKKRKEVTSSVNNVPTSLATKEVEVEKEEVVEAVEEVAEVVTEVVVPVTEEKKEDVVPEIVEKKEPVVNMLTVEDFKNDIIRFELNSSKQTASLDKQVKSIAEKLNNSPSTIITLGGYTDRSGSNSFNKYLSIQRAKWVKDQLVRKYGIPNNRITVIGHGSAGTTQDYDPNNRKVEVIEVR
ncbi:MAG: outer membrane protein OmpA-like peptidoglycan-associated protein [Vicingaceae bacterium]|jgi:outer membrane protein OmpA-like peptidoglycan-associated protein